MERRNQIRRAILKTAVIVPMVGVAIITSFNPVYAEIPNRGNTKEHIRIGTSKNRRNVNFEKKLRDSIKKAEKIENRISKLYKSVQKRGKVNKVLSVKEDIDKLREMIFNAKQYLQKYIDKTTLNINLDGLEMEILRFSRNMEVFLNNNIQADALILKRI